MQNLIFFVGDFHDIQTWAKIFKTDVIKIAVSFYAAHQLFS